MAVELSERTAVYKAYDEGGALIYVGIARNWGHRWSQHSLRSDFFERVAALKIEWFPSREMACARERQLIDEQRPRFNLRAGIDPVNIGRGRRTPLPADKHLRCDRCPCTYLEDPEFGWVEGEICGDWSEGWPPCRGRLVIDERRATA